MRFFKRKKGKTPKSSPPLYADSGTYPPHGFAQPESSAAYSPRPYPPPTRVSAAILAQLPTSILERIFTFVCPHTQDESYETCEESAEDNACMLCDLRDISSCGKTCKRWRESARKLMYHSIRIDSVHYCEREHILAERRKRNFLDRNADPEDTALKRLQLLARSVREAPTHLGHLVQFLKTPYMLRQAAQADLARAINVMPNLRYVDLPDGFFTGDPVYHILRAEVEACCRNLRRMKFQAGSELTLAKLAGGTTWPVLETVELDRVNIDPVTLRHVLGVLPKLRALKVTECPAFTDDLFWEYDGVAPFPPLAEFILSKTPNVTAAGLTEWLQQGHARNVLKVLTLTATGVKTWTLHQIVANAPTLTHLSLIDVVDTAFPAANAGNAYDSLALPLTSKSLQSLHYEITPSPAAGPFGATATASHYAYLSQSLLGGGLPGLKQLYVRDPTFPDTLLGLPPPMPAFAGEAGSFRPRSGSAGMLPSPKSGSLSPPSGNGGINRPTSLSPLSMNHTGGAGAGTRLSSNNPFGRQLAANIPPLLEVFTKGDEDLDWSLLQIGPGGYGNEGRGSHSRTGSMGRPMSGYGLGADIMGGVSGWGAGQSRRSVMVGDGAGGFLAVPGEEQGGMGHKKAGSTVSSSAGKGPWGIGSDDEGEDLWPGSIARSSTGEKRRDLWR